MEEVRRRRDERWGGKIYFYKFFAEQSIDEEE
jgi:hypothetical protein